MRFNNKLSEISWNLVFLYAFAIAGFPLISIIPVFLGIESRPVSVLYRVFFVVLSIIVFLWVGVKENKLYSGHFWFFILYLWLLLITRLTWDSFFYPNIFIQPVNEYYLTTIGIGFIPMCAFFVRPNIASLKAAHIGSLFLSIIAIVGLLYAATLIDIQTLLIGRLSTEVLNPISVGHLGVSLVILSITYLQGRKHKIFSFNSVLRYIPFMVGVLLGVGVSIASASRGPIISLIIVLFVYSVSSIVTHRTSKMLFALFITSVALISIIIYMEKKTFIQPVSRMVSTYEFEDASSSFRSMMIRDAIDQFKKNPLSGSATVELNSKTYPHNILVECLMATGVIGGIFLIVVLAWSAKASWRLICRGAAFSWIGLLFVQYFVAELFSGSLFLGASIWYLSVAAVTIESTIPSSSFRRVS